MIDDRHIAAGLGSPLAEVLRWRFPDEYPALARDALTVADERAGRSTEPRTGEDASPICAGDQQ